MRLHLCFAMVVAVFLAVAAPSRAATCAPQKLIHIRFADVTPGIDQTSFAAMPKDLFRIDSGKVRVEEALDAANGIHAIDVTDEPNLWMANLFDHTGKHIVDPGPTFFAKVPIFGATYPGKLSELEFGCESDFIAANARNPVHTEVVAGTTYDVFKIEDGSDSVEILRAARSATPTFARYYHQGTLQSVVRYDLYLTDLPDDPNLFLPPADIKYTESNGSSS